MSRRTERVGSLIRDELATVIQRELNDPRLTGMPSITRVSVSEDLSAADVYVTIMGTPGQQTAALNALRHSAGLMRTRLTHAMTLRQAPFLRFHIDENLKKELEVLDLLRRVDDERAEMDERARQLEARLQAEAEARKARLPPEPAEPPAPTPPTPPTTPTDVIPE